MKGTTDKIELVLNEIEGFVRDNKGEVSLVIKKARETIEKAGEMIKAFEGTAKTLSSTINSTSKSVDMTIMSVDKTVKSVDQAIDLQSQNLDQLLNLMTRTTEDLQDLIQELKAKPWGLIYKEGKGREE